MEAKILGIKEKDASHFEKCYQGVGRLRPTLDGNSFPFISSFKGLA